MGSWSSSCGSSRVGCLPQQLFLKLALKAAWRMSQVSQEVRRKVLAEMPDAKRLCDFPLLLFNWRDAAEVGHELPFYWSPRQAFSIGLQLVSRVGLLALVQHPKVHDWERSSGRNSFRTRVKASPRRGHCTKVPNLRFMSRRTWSSVAFRTGKKNLYGATMSLNQLCHAHTRKDGHIKAERTWGVGILLMISMDRNVPNTSSSARQFRDLADTIKHIFYV